MKKLSVSYDVVKSCNGGLMITFKKMSNLKSTLKADVRTSSITLAFGDGSGCVLKDVPLGYMSTIKAAGRIMVAETENGAVVKNYVVTI